MLLNIPDTALNVACGVAPLAPVDIDSANASESPPDMAVVRASPNGPKVALLYDTPYVSLNSCGKYK